MGLETKTIKAIKQKWQESDIGVPSAYWQYGTLWVDHPPAGGSRRAANAPRPLFPALRGQRAQAEHSTCRRRAWRVVAAHAVLAH